jgi:hypothetical protein
MTLRRISVLLVLALAALPGLASAEVLLASAARTTSGTATLTASVVNQWRAAAFLLDVTVAATDAGDTLDVYLQSSVDGSTWDDFAHFTQVLGNGGAKKFVATWTREITPESELKAPADGSLAAGVLQGPNASSWRVKWVIVDAGTANVSFTFSLAASGLLR